MKRLLLLPLVLTTVALLVACAPPQISPEQYASVTADLNAAQSQIKTQQADLDKAQSQIKALQADLAKAQSETKTVQGDLETAQSQIKTLQAHLDTGQSQVKTLQTDLEAAQSQIKTLQGDTTAQYQVRTVQAQLQAATGKLEQIKTKMVLVNYVWVPTIQGRTLDTITIQSWLELVNSIGDSGVTVRYYTLLEKHDNPSAIELLNYLFQTITNALS